MPANLAMTRRIARRSMSTILELPPGRRREMIVHVVETECQNQGVSNDDTRRHISAHVHSILSRHGFMDR
jgi:hypothetical protein